MTQKAAARLLKISRSTLSDLLHRAIIRDGHRIRGLKSIGVDEISYCKRHRSVKRNGERPPEMSVRPLRDFDGFYLSIPQDVPKKTPASIFCGRFLLIGKFGYSLYLKATITVFPKNKID
ncbi:MAG: hypothetical protein B6I32_03565 [Desulfobacterium sp. 4572_20]|nr:MAG: hypothetical protein B6I32_03565 [Desulfobacterium sp. 4572_20]